MNQNDCQYNPMPLYKMQRITFMDYNYLYEFLEKNRKKEIPLHSKYPLKIRTFKR
jgi:hypothetical protein